MSSVTMTCDEWWSSSNWTNSPPTHRPIRLRLIHHQRLRVITLTLTILILLTLLIHQVDAQLPSINSITPLYGLSGTPVTINGNNFVSTATTTFFFQLTSSQPPVAANTALTTADPITVVIPCTGVNVVSLPNTYSCVPTQDIPIGFQAWFKVKQASVGEGPWFTDKSFQWVPPLLLNIVMSATNVIRDVVTPITITGVQFSPWTPDLVTNTSVVGSANPNSGIGFQDSLGFAWLYCTSLTYLSASSVVCTPSGAFAAGTWSLAWKYSSGYTQLATNAQSQQLVTLNALPTFTKIYSPFSAWSSSTGFAASNTPTWTVSSSNTGAKVFRMTIPASQITAGGTGLILRFMAPYGTSNLQTKFTGFGTNNYGITEVTLGFKATGNVWATHDSSSLTTIDVFPTSFTQVTFANFTWSAVSTLYGYQYLDSNPITIPDYCLKAYDSSQPIFYDLILSFKRTTTYSADLAPSTPFTPSPMQYLDPTANPTASSTASWEGFTPTGDARLNVGLESIYVTGGDTGLDNCLTPVITSVSPAWVLPGGKITITGTNFVSSMLVSYSFSTSSNRVLYNGIQYATSYACANQVWTDGTFTSVICTLTSSAPVGDYVAFLLYHPTRAIMTATSTTLVEVYPDILNQASLSFTSSAQFVSTGVVITLAQKTIPDNDAANLITYYNSPGLGYIDPNRVFHTCDTQYDWIDQANGVIRCTFTPALIGNYTFTARSSLGLSASNLTTLFTVYSEFTQLYLSGTNGPQDMTWQPYTVPTGAANSYRFTIPIANFSTNIKTSNIVLRLYPLSSTWYYVNYVSLALGFGNNSNIFPNTEALVTWANNPIGADWSYGVNVSAGSYADSNPISWCFNTAVSPVYYDMTVTMHITQATSPSVAAKYIIPSTYFLSNTYAVADSSVTGNTNGVTGLAVRQTNWNGYSGNSGYIVSSSLPLIGIDGIYKVSNSSCINRPFVTAITPNTVAPNVAFTVTITGSNFGTTGQPTPVVTYDPTTQGALPITGFSSTCTNVVRLSSTQLTCTVGTDLNALAIARFIVSFTASTGVPSQLSQVNTTAPCLVSATYQLLSGLSVSPMSTAIGVPINITLTTTFNSTYFTNIFTISMYDTTLGTTTACGVGSFWKDSTHYVCVFTNPSHTGTYLFSAALASGVNVVGSVNTTFTVFNIFSPIFLTNTTYLGGVWTNATTGTSTTSRTVLPVSTFLGSGASLVMRMYASSTNNAAAPATFDTVSLSIGLEKPSGSISNYSADAYTPYLIPVTFGAIQWQSSVTVLTDNFWDSNPIPLCVNITGDVRYDLVYTIHRASGGWAFDTSSSTGRAAASFSVPDSSLTYAKSSHWDELPVNSNTFTNSRSIIGLAGLYATSNGTNPGPAGLANTTCAVPTITSVILGTVLTNQPLFITIVGYNFNNLSQSLLDASRSSDGTITAIQVSYFVLSGGNGVINQSATGIDFRFGNASLCTGLVVKDGNTMTCTLSTLTSTYLSLNVSLEIFQFGQLSQPFIWQIGLPTFINALANSTITPQNGLVGQFTNITINLASNFPSSLFQAISTLGYIDPNGVFYPCPFTNFSSLDLSHVVCGFYPTLVGTYNFQVSFYNGFNSSTLQGGGGQFGAWPVFNTMYSNNLTYLSNPLWAANAFAIQSVTPEGGSPPVLFRMTLPKQFYRNTSSIILRLYCPPDITTGYTINQVSIGKGRPGTKDVFPSSVTRVYFNNMTLAGDINNKNWFTNVFIPPNSYVDSMPIPYILFNPAYNLADSTYPSWDVLVTINLVSGATIPSIYSTTSLSSYNSWYINDFADTPPLPAAYPSWTAISTYTIDATTVDDVNQDATFTPIFMVDSLIAVNENNLNPPRITNIYPQVGAAASAVTITLYGSGFTVPSLSSPYGWQVTYAPTSGSAGTTLPASSSTCGTVKVVSDSQMTCVTSTDISIGMVVQFIIGNTLTGTAYSSLISQPSVQNFTGLAPMLNGIIVSPQTVKASSASTATLTVQLGTNIDGNGYAATSYDFGVVPTTIGFINTATGSTVKSCQSFNWVTGGLTANFTSFQCVLPTLLSPGQYVFQATFNRSGTTTPPGLTNLVDYVMFSSALNSLSFFVAYSNVREIVNTTSLLNYGPSGGVTFAQVQQAINPGISPVANSNNAGGGATFRFIIPPVATPTSVTQAMVVRMAATPTGYTFSGMTIGLGIASGSGAVIDMFNNTVQTVPFGGSPAYTSQNGNSVDKAITVPPGIAYDSNPIFFCYNTTNLWSLILTIHGFYGSTLPALNATGVLPVNQSVFLFNDVTTQPLGYNLSQWSDRTYSGEIYQLNTFRAVGIESIYTVDYSQLPTYFNSTMSLPPNGVSSCTVLPLITAVGPAYVYPRTSAIVTLTGRNFVNTSNPGIAVYYGVFGGFGTVPTTTTTLATSFTQNPCTNISIISTTKLTCWLGTNVQRGQTIQFIVTNGWSVSNVSPTLFTQLNFIYQGLSGLNGNSYVHPLLPNPFPQSPVFDPLLQSVQQLLTNGTQGAYNITVPYVINTLNVTVKSQIGNTIAYWMIGASSTTIANAIAAAPFPNYVQIRNDSAPINAFYYTPLSVGNNYFMIWSQVDNLTYPYSIFKLGPDIQTLTVSPWPLSADFTSTTLPSTYVASVNSYTITVPYITANVSISIKFGTAGSITVDLNGASSVLAVSNGPVITFPLALGTNYININSSRDGNYTWTITRVAPDTQSISVNGYDYLRAAQNYNSLISPAFNPLLTYPSAVFSFTIPYIKSAVTFTSTFTKTGTQFVSKVVSGSDQLGAYINAAGYAAYANQVSLVNNVASQQYNLTVGVNTFRVNSTLDGIYYYQITRLDPQLRNVTVIGLDPVDIDPIVNVGSFVPGVFNLPAYAFTLGRAIEGINVTLNFTGSGAGITMTINQAPLSLTPWPGANESIISGGSIEIAYDLLLGVNILYINSSLDGIYTIPITRYPSDFSSILFIGNSSTAYPNQFLPTPSVPAWIPGNTTTVYNVTVPFGIWTLTGNFTFKSAGTVGLACDYGLQTIANGSIPSSVFFTPPFALRTMDQGPNTVSLYSLVDGTYTFLIWRRLPDIQTLALSQTKVPGAIVKGPATATNPFFNSSIYFYNYTVFYGSSYINPAMTYKTPGTVRLDLNSVTFQNSTSNADPNEILGIAGFNLTLGWNTLHIGSSLDGLYTFNIFRLNPDLISIALRAETVNGTLISVNFGTPSSFTPGVRTYQITLSYKYKFMQFNMQFTQPVNIYSTNTNGYNVVSGRQVTSGAWTESLLIDPTTPAVPAFVFKISSDSDLDYIIQVTRQQNNIQRLLVFANQGKNVYEDSNDINKVNSNGVVLTPPFTAGIYNYTLSVPYVVSSVSIKLFTAGNTDGIILDYFDQYTTVTTHNVLTNATVSGPYNLWLDNANNFTITSWLDGQFFISITRRLPDLDNIIVVGDYPTSPLDSTPVAITTAFDREFFPSYQGFIGVPNSSNWTWMNYSVMVDYRVNQVQFIVDFLDPYDNVTVARNGTGVVLAQLQDLSNLTTAPFFPLTVGSNIYLVAPNLDGVYPINIIRAQPDVRQVVFASYNTSGPLIQSNVTLYTYDPNPLLTKSPLSFNASGFIPGQLIYNVFLPYSQGIIQLNNLTFNAANITLDASVASATTNLTSYFNQLISFSTSTISSSQISITAGGALYPTRIRLDDVFDGPYFFQVYRGNAWITYSNVPDSLQSNFSTSTLPVGTGIELNLGGLLHYPDLRVQVTADFGTPSPNILDFSTAYETQTLRFQFLAPFVAQQAVFITLKFQLLGLDAWQIDPLPDMKIKIFPTNTTILGSITALTSTFPSTVAISSTTPGLMVISNGVDGRPLGTNILSLSIFPSAGSVFPTTINFTNANWFNNQTFSFIAPNLAKNVSFTFSLQSYNGLTNWNNYQQYIYPVNFTTTVQVLGTVTIGSPFVASLGWPTTLYNNQLSNQIAVIAAGVAKSNFTLNISSSTLALAFNSSSLVFKSFTSGSYLTFTVQPFFGQLVSSTVVYVNFIISGPDAALYLPIGQMAFTVLPQATFSVTGVPTFLYVNNGMGSRVITVTPSVGPNGGTLRVIPVGASVVGTGLTISSFMSFTAGSVAPASFSITVAPSVAQTLTLMFTLALNDVAHFLPPAPITIPILPLAFINILNVPGQIYANSQTGNIIIQPSTILSVDQYGVGFTVWVTASNSAIVSPSAFYSFGGVAAISQASFTVTPATNFVGTITLSYVVSGPLTGAGSDSTIYNSTIPSQTIQVLSQGSFAISGFPTYGVVSNGLVSVAVQPLVAPANNGTVTLTMTISQGTFATSATLTFTSIVSQTFTFRAPSSPININVDWVIGGSQAAQFSKPAGIVVNVLASMTLINAPLTMYVNQISDPMTITPQIPSISAPTSLFPTNLNVLFSPATSGGSATSNPIAFPTPAPSTFTFTAPPTVPVANGGVITLSFSLSGSLAQSFFAAPSSISIQILPQNTMSITGVTSLYAFDSTVLTLMPNVPVVQTTVVTFSLGTYPGSISPTSVTLPAGYSQATAAVLGLIQVTYYSPAYTTPAQTIVITSTTSGAGGAQFIGPSVTIDMRGVYLLSICQPATGLYVTGILANGGDWNGVYQGNSPINGKPHYQLASTLYPGTIYHLFYYVDPAGVYPSAWILDTNLYSSHATGYVNLDAAAPFSSTWTYGLQVKGSVGVGAKTIGVTCGVDCSLLGTATSLETQVCFGGQPLLTSPSTPSVCSLSCAKYLPLISAQCKTTPYYRQTNVITPITSLLTTCQTCNNSYVSNVMSTCEMSLTSSDVKQDLLQVLSLPSTATCIKCGLSFTGFYSTCVTNQAIIPSSFSTFNAQCSPTQPPRQIATISLVQSYADSLVLTWTPAVQVQLTPLPVTYYLAVLNQNQTAWNVIYSGSENSFTVASLAANTTYQFQVIGGTAAGNSTASSSFAFSTAYDAPPAPTFLDYTPFTLIVPASAVLPTTFSSVISWNRSSVSLTATDVQYRLTITKASDSSFTNFGTEEIVFTGFRTSFTYTHFIPGISYVLAVYAQSFRLSTDPLLNGTTSRFSAPITLGVVVGFTQPPVPQFDSASAVSSSSVSFNWPNVVYCGQQICTGFFYEIQAINLGITNQLLLGLPGTSSATSAPLPASTVFNQWYSIGNVTMPTTPSDVSIIPTPNVPLNFIWTKAALGCSYQFQIRVNSLPGNSSSWSSSVSLAVPGILPSVLRTVDYQLTTSTTIQVYWNHTLSFYDDGSSPVNMIHFQLVPQTGNTDMQTHDYYFALSSLQFQPTSAYGYSSSLTGLVAGGSYQLFWEVRNTIGWSSLTRSLPIAIVMPDTPPHFVSFLAYDPTQSLTGFGTGNIMTLTFDKPTNKPDLSQQAYIDAMISFTSAIPAAYTGVWSQDGTVLSIVIGTTLPSAATSPPQVGVFTATIIGNLYNAALTSTSLATESSLVTTQTLLGSWTSHVSSHLISPATMFYVQGDSTLNSIVLPVAPASSSVVYTGDAIALMMVVSNGVLVYPYAPAFGFPLSSATSRTSTMINGHIYSDLLQPNATSNPFYQIAYTPATGFYGTDVLQVTLNGVLGTETLSVPIRVLQVNHAPVVTVGTLGFDPYLATTTGYALTGLAVSDIDNIGTTLMTVTYSSPSPTAWFTYLTTLPTGLSSSIILPGTQVNSLIITGTYTSIAPFISQVAWFDPAIDPDTTTSTYANIKVDDLGSGITGAKSIATEVKYVFTPSCLTSSIPQMIDVSFSSDLTSLVVTFDGTRVKFVPPTGTPLTQTALTQCSLFFDSTTVASFGTTPLCYLSSPTTLSVQLGAGFTVRVSSFVTLNTVTHSIRRCLSSSGYALGSFQVASPASPILPVVQLLGPASIGICQDLILSTTLTNVTGAVTYSWTVTPDTMNGIIPESVASSSASLVIPAASLVSGTTYTFTVSVMNLIGSISVPSSVTVTKSSRPTPTLTPITPTTLMVRTTDSFVLSSYGNISSCLSAILPPTQAVLGYSWTAVAIGSTVTSVNLDSNSRLTSSLTVAPGTLQASTNYIFTVTAVVSGDVTLKASLNFTVSVAATTQTIVPTESSQVISVNSTLILAPTAVSGSSTASTPLVWSCLTSIGASCINAWTQQPISSQTVAAGVTLTIPAGTFSPDTYVWTATTIPTGFGQAAATVNIVTVTVISSPASAPSPPTVAIKSSALIVASYDSLFLTSTLTGSDGLPVNSSASYYKYEWCLAPSSAAWSGLIDTTLTQGRYTSSLTINKDNKYLNAFPGDISIRFHLTVTDTRFTNIFTFAELAIEVIGAPSGGTVTVSPMTGSAGVTTFTVSAVNWVSGSSVNSLTYKYYLVSPTDSSLIGFGQQPGSAQDQDVIQFAGTGNSNSMILLCKISDLSGATVTVATNITVVPVVSSTTAVTNAMIATVQSLTQLGGGNQLLSFISSAVLASEQTLVSVNTSSTSVTQSFSGANVNNYTGSYARCYVATTATTSVWSPTFSSAADTTTTLNARITLLLAALTTSISTADLSHQSTACLSLANDPAISSSFTFASQLYGLCQPVITNALTSSKTLCQSTSVGCYASQLQLLNSTLAMSESLLEAYLLAVQADASTASLSRTNRRLLATSQTILDTSSYVLPTLLGQISAVFDRYSQVLLTAPSASFINNDCQIPSIVSRDIANVDWSFSFVDGTTVTYPLDAGLASSAQPIVDTRAIYHINNPYTYFASSQVGFTLVSGVVTAQRSDISTYQALAGLQAVVTLKYSTANCNASCTPICLVFNPATNVWAKSIGTGPNATTVIPSSNGHAGFVDCLIPGYTSLIVGVFNAPSLFPAQPSSSSSTGSASSSTGPVTSASSSTGPNYGGLNGPPPPVVTLPQPTIQLWGINATFIFALDDTFFLTADQLPNFKANLLSDLSKSLGIASYRIILNTITPGSIVVQLYILPSTNSSDPTPADAWANMQSQIGVPGSTFSSGAVTSSYSQMVFTSYIPSTLCPNGLYQIACVYSSSTGGSSTGVASSSSSTAGQLVVDNGSVSTGFLGSSQNRLIFIIGVAVGGFFVLLLLAVLLYYCCKSKPQPKLEESNEPISKPAEPLVKAFAPRGTLQAGSSSMSNLHAHSSQNSTKINPMSSSRVSAPVSGRVHSSVKDRNTPSPSLGAPSQVAMTSGTNGSRESSTNAKPTRITPPPVATTGFTSSVQSSHFFQQNEGYSAALSPSQELALARSPAGPYMNQPPMAQTPVVPVMSGGVMLEKGNSPSTENTPTHTPRTGMSPHQRPQMANPQDINVQFSLGSSAGGSSVIPTSSSSRPPMAGAVRLPSTTGSTGPRAGVKRFPSKLNANILAEAAGMVGSNPSTTQ